MWLCVEKKSKVEIAQVRSIENSWIFSTIECTIFLNIKKYKYCGKI